MRVPPAVRFQNYPFVKITFQSESLSSNFEKQTYDYCADMIRLSETHASNAKVDLWLRKVGGYYSLTNNLYQAVSCSSHYAKGGNTENGDDSVEGQDQEDEDNDGKQAAISSLLSPSPPSGNDNADEFE